MMFIKKGNLADRMVTKTEEINEFLRRIAYEFLMMLIFAIFLRLGIFILTEPKFDPIVISNAGFAVLLALSSITFTWAKTFEDELIVKKLNWAATRGIISALSFIIGSLTQYMNLKLKHSNTFSFFESLDSEFYTVLTMFFFFIALTSCYIMLRRIIFYSIPKR